jgi:hypothetical protein
LALERIRPVAVEAGTPTNRTTDIAIGDREGSGQGFSKAANSWVESGKGDFAVARIERNRERGNAKAPLPASETAFKTALLQALGQAWRNPAHPIHERFRHEHSPVRDKSLPSKRKAPPVPP